jgi:phospholipase C
VGDAFHAAVPGPTEINRMYAYSATSHGSGSNKDPQVILGYPQKSIFESLEEANKTWGYARS